MTLAELRTELTRLGAARAEQRSQLEQAYVELASTPAGEDADRLIEAIAERRRQTLLLKARAAETVRRELDPRQFAPQLDGSVPILLMPLRVQTRFQNAANGRVLLIRVYPDDVSVERHEPRLSVTERAAGEQFWSGDAADQKHPADEYRDGEASQRRHDHRSQTENGEHDAFEQEGFPMRLHRGAHFRLQLGDVVAEVFTEVLGKGHWKLPMPAAPNGEPV